MEPGTSNLAGTAALVYTQLQRTRALADSSAVRFRTLRADTAESDLRLARVLAYGGMTYVLMAEHLCAAPVNRSRAYTPRELLDTFALARFDDAIRVATAARAAAAAAVPVVTRTVNGADSLIALARVGAARANLDLWGMSESDAYRLKAVEHASAVPAAFLFYAHYSDQADELNNFVWSRLTNSISASVTNTPFEALRGLDPRIPIPTTQETAVGGLRVYVPNSPTAYTSYSPTQPGAEFGRGSWVRRGVSPGLVADGGARVRECDRKCESARVRECESARVRECESARVVGPTPTRGVMMGMRLVRTVVRGGLLAAAAVGMLGACAGNRPAAAQTMAAAGDSIELPPVPREFRAVWVATVANIDWPSRAGLPMDSVHAELIALMDRAQSLHLNAIVLQVRPAADAIYPSELEPWSEYVTGASGRAPDPRNPVNGYDPLRAAVEAAHQRGMELHAWFNPYRARHPSARTPAAESHISRRRPDLVRQYGAFQWMDPGEPEVRARTLAVVLDVVRRYDVDGVHLDDYFYPYPETDTSTKQPIDFPDEPSWRRYLDGGGRLSRSDWRRENVNTLIRELYEGIHREKPWVRFGISPFGIWRPGYPAGQGTRFDQHEQLYADARKWIREGWVDYYTPQLYWAISRPDLSYPVLLRWWIEQNVHGRHMWPGNFTSRVPREWRAEEITDQVWVTRGMPGATGNVHFSMKAFLQNPDSLNERLLRGPYRQAALPPATPWLGGRVLPAPRVTPRPGAGGTFLADIVAAPGEAPRWYVVRSRRAGTWRVEVISAWTQVYGDVEAGEGPPVDLVVVTPVDRLGIEGESAYVRPGTSR